MNKYIEIFIKNKLNEISSNETKEYIQKYLPFYIDITQDDLASLFAFFTINLTTYLAF